MYMYMCIFYSLQEYPFFEVEHHSGIALQPTLSLQEEEANNTITCGTAAERGSFEESEHCDTGMMTSVFSLYDVIVLIHIHVCSIL